MQHSELLLEPFSSAAASCACEQCCCVTHMQLPEMLCNGRWQEGEPSEPAGRGPRRPAAASRGVCSASALSPAIGGEPARGERPRPAATAIGEPAGPRALLAGASRQPEGGKALTHSASGPAFVLVSVHTLPFGVTAYC